MSDVAPPREKRLDGRVAIVTGGGRGIGRAVAGLFAQHGAKVLIATRTGARGDAAVAEITAAGGTARSMEVTIATVESVTSTIARAIELWGRIDIIVHNASSTLSGLLTDLPDDALQGIFDTSANPAFWFIKHGFPHLKQSPAGRLLFTSSVAADRFQDGYAAYGTMKAAINGIVQGAALELGPYGITVNAVAPGATRTELFLETVPDRMQQDWAAMIALRRLGEVQDIARAMLFLASDEASYITGEVMRVDGGQSLPQRGPW